MYVQFEVFNLKVYLSSQLPVCDEYIIGNCLNFYTFVSLMEDDKIETFAKVIVSY